MRVEATGYRAILDAQGFSFESSHSTSGTSDANATFHPLSAQRGACAWSLDAVPYSSWQVSGNTAQALLNPEAGLVEHYEARGTGVELTWILTRSPEGNGDLLIDTAVDGLHFSRQTASGLHFADAGGMERMKVNRAIAVDQHGHTWPIELTMAGGALRATVPETVLAQAQFPLAIDPLISAEFGMDQPIDSSTPCTQAAPVVAVNESGYLVAWTHGKGETTDAAVYAARVSLSGSILDRTGILVSTIAGEQTTCAVAANPSGFLIVWSTPHGTSITDWDILGARIQSDGTVLDVPPLPLCTVAGVQTAPAVAANGSNYLATWRDSRGTGIYGTLITADGIISPTNGFPICTAANDQYMPAVAALGADYLVAWQDYRTASATKYTSDIYAARVTGGGVLIDTNGIAVCTRTNSQHHPAIAANGANYLVIWEEYDVAGNDIAGARVSADGLLLDTNALVISHAGNAQVNPVLTSVGSDYLVLWEDYRASPANRFEAIIYGTRVTSAGTVMDPDGVPFSGTSGQCKPALAVSAGNGMVVWQDTRNNPATALADIYGARASLSSNLVVATDFTLNAAANAQTAPATAANGTQYLVVWSDSRNQPVSGQDIYGLRLSQDGTLLDPTAFPICTATNAQTDPVVTANGGIYLVAWADWRATPANAVHADIYGSLVDLAGTVLQPQGIPICTATNDQSQPAIAPLGTNFLAVWRDARNSSATVTRLDIFGARITSSGEVLDMKAFPICTNSADQSTPAVAAGQNQALVVWTDARISALATDIYGARMAVEGTVAETNGFAICAATFQQAMPAVASDGANYLVVWADSRNGAANAPDIYGAKVDAGGVVQPTNGFAIRLAPGVQTAPVAAYGGGSYLAVWQEARMGQPNNFDIIGAPIDSDGGLSSSFLLPVASGSNTRLAPNLIAGADGRFLAANQALYSDGRRVMANFLSPQAMPILKSSLLFEDQKFQFTLQGSVLERYAIEASSDLKKWTTLMIFTNTATQRIDIPITHASSQFYRAVLLP